MSSVSFVVLLVGSMAVILEGASSMVSHDRSTGIGVLNCCLGVMGIFLVWFLYTGSLVVAPEFGVVMVQGSATVLSFAAVLIGVSVLPVLCLQQTCSWRPGGERWTVHLAIGVGIGIWAAFRLQVINPLDPPELQIRMFDAWWPLLLLWLTYCFIAISLSLTTIRNWLLEAALVAACASGLARFALVHQELSDPESRPIWAVVQIAALLASGALAAGILFTRKPRFLWLIPISLPVLAGVAAMFPLRENLFYGRMNPIAGAALLLAIGYGLGWLRVGATAMLRRLRHHAEETDQEPGAQNAAVVAPLAAAPASWRHRATRLLLWTSLLIVPFATADLLSIGQFARMADFLILLLAWLAFSAVLAQKALDELPKLVIKFLREHPIFGAPAIGRGWRFLKNAGGKTYAGCRKVAAFGSRLTGWGIAVGAVVLGLAGLVIDVTVGEISNYNKLVLEPLTYSGASGDETARMAGRIGDGITNELGNIRKEMNPELRLSVYIGRHSSDTQRTMLPVVLDNGAVQAAMAKSADIQLSEHVTIPVSIFAEPIQRVVRTALRIHTVGGSLYLVGDKKAPIVYLHSDHGESWKISPDDTPDIVPAAAVPAPSQDLGAGKAAKAVPQAADPDADFDAWSCRNPVVSTDPAERIVQEAAFYVASGDPSFVQMGMTRSWLAYRAFRNGVTRWSSYESSNDSGDLNQAIACFSRAFQIDSTFALAEYRAGIALANAGEYQNAVQAFDACLHADPTFIQAESAKAEALTADPSSLYRPAVANFGYPRDRTSEANRLWAEVASSPDTKDSKGLRIAAYYGLCSHQFVLAEAGNPRDNKFYVNYFYCSRAEAIYHHLPASTRQDPERVQLEASILYLLGETLRYHDYSDFKDRWPARGNAPTVSHWLCDTNLATDYDPSGETIGFDIPGSALTSHALRYYRRALRLIPGDASLRCDIAAAEAYLRKDAEKPMKTLYDSEAAHLFLANQFSSREQRWIHRFGQRLDTGFGQTWSREGPADYRRALYEYVRAQQLAPTDFDALNNYAYVVWQWALDAKIADSPDAPNAQELAYAEYSAREAIRVSRWRQNSEEEAMAEDTLGEILLAEGRNHDAVKRLEKALRDNASAGAFQIDEVRWDLAQAYSCDVAGRTGDARPENAAAALYQQIAVNESKREFRPFLWTPGSLDGNAATKRCFKTPAEQVDNGN